MANLPEKPLTQTHQYLDYIAKNIGGGGGTYVAGDGINIENNTISVDTETIATKSDLTGKQNTLTAGSNITISEDTISATDTTYGDFVGATVQQAGTAGLVPAPTTADTGKFLKGDGTWGAAPTGPTVVQTTGSSTTEVMSQKSVTDIIGDVESLLSTINNGSNL